MIDTGSTLRLLLTVLLAGGAAWLVDRWTELRGVLPPGFESPWRRAAAFLVVASILFIGVFLPLALLGESRTLEPADVSGPRVFLLQSLLVLSLVAWFVLGYAGRGGRSLAGQFARQFGLRSERPGFELALGLAAGAAGWVLVIALVVAVAAGIWLAGGQDLLPKAPPDVIPLIAALPLGMRIALGLTAGVVEETFFRGFLQPRVGIALSTALFVLAHLSYEQPFMLVGHHLPVAALRLPGALAPDGAAGDRGPRGIRPGAAPVHHSLGAPEAAHGRPGVGPGVAPVTGRKRRLLC